MNNLLIFCVGLSIVVPAQLHSLNKQKIKTTAKISIGCASAIGATIILHNIASTAQRRIANPEYEGSKSFAAILGQMCSILLHNKGLATIVFGLTGLSAYCMSSATAELCDASHRDSQEL
jgi:hypothetical protein